MNQNEVHSIRLRGPWNRAVGGAAEQKITLPDFCEVGSSEQVTYRRPFNRPSGIDPSTRVYVLIDCWQGGLRSVQINGTELLVAPTDDPPLRVEITKCLIAFNRLSISACPADGTVVGLTGEVRLEIETGG